MRPPAQLAETGHAPATRPDRTAGAEETPARPEYPVISSGWEDEDTGPASKTSDLMTAVRAGLVLLVLMVGLGLLIR
ncbi:hypothetical protein [Falsiroseomonas sp. E2-1-a4]|uniref:hypothetical protein n=1 Tax=Falsiroseomonas sp. E2-1-a4 TaxID=3239299 RepID=UPI003F3A738F